MQYNINKQLQKFGGSCNCSKLWTFLACQRGFSQKSGYANIFAFSIFNFIENKQKFLWIDCNQDKTKYTLGPGYTF